MPRNRPGRLAVLFTITVFILLASVDNAVLDMAPSIFWAIQPALQATGVEMGAANAILIWTTAITAIPWGVLGDRTNRKRLLLYGTAIWASGSVLAPFMTLPGYVVMQFVLGTGLGCIASVGFSIITDLVVPARRGLAMSAWSIAQGLGTAAGKAIAAIIVTSTDEWWLPYVLLSATGFVLLVLYGFTTNPSRGATEQELAGCEYEYTLTRADIPLMLRKRTNIGLILHASSAEVFWGGFSWLPFIIARKLAIAGLPDGTSGLAGNVIMAAFFVGGLVAPGWGLLGDKVRRRRLEGRPLLIMAGTTAGIILFLLAISVPFEPAFIALDTTGNQLDVINGIIALVLGAPAVTTFFVLAFLAMAGFSSDLPNSLAVGIDVNLPEHRGTIFSLINLTRGAGRGTGTILIPLLAGTLFSTIPEPGNLVAAIIMALLAYVPSFAGMLVQARFMPADAAWVSATLASRARDAAATREPV